MPPTPNDAAVEAATRHWVERVVVGLSLCPFARAVLPRLRIVVSAARNIDELLDDLGAELERLVETDVDEVPTTLVVTPHAFGDFYAYLDAIEVVEAVLADTDLEGEIQVASFHPDYCFEGAPADDPANLSNRSPYPMFHLLREDEVSRAVDSHPDPEGIPPRNIALLRSMGADAIRALLD